MYESPITQIIADISSQVREAQDGRLIYEVQQAIGYEINKEELIKALNYDRNQYQKGYEDGRKDNEWIPVSERLPDVGSEVLVCYEFKKKRYVYIANYYGDGSFHGYDDEYLTTEGRKYRKAVAWKPLPEPYKAESGVSK